MKFKVQHKPHTRPLLCLARGNFCTREFLLYTSTQLNQCHVIPGIQHTTIIFCFAELRGDLFSWVISPTYTQTNKSRTISTRLQQYHFAVLGVPCIMRPPPPTRNLDQCNNTITQPGFWHTTTSCLFLLYCHDCVGPRQRATLQLSVGRPHDVSGRLVLQVVSLNGGQGAVGGVGGGLPSMLLRAASTRQQGMYVPV